MLGPFPPSPTTRRRHPCDGSRPSPALPSSPPPPRPAPARAAARREAAALSPKGDSPPGAARAANLRPSAGLTLAAKPTSIPASTRPEREQEALYARAEGYARRAIELD